MIMMATKYYIARCKDSDPVIPVQGWSFLSASGKPIYSDMEVGPPNVMLDGLQTHEY